MSSRSSRSSSSTSTPEARLVDGTSPALSKMTTTTVSGAPSPWIPLLLLSIAILLIGIPSLGDYSNLISGATESLGTWTLVLPVVLVIAVQLLREAPAPEASAAGEASLSVYSSSSPAGGSSSADGPRWGFVLMFILFIVLLHLCKRSD